MRTGPLGVLLFAAGCAGPRPVDCLREPPAVSGLGGNVLVVLMDDLGVDKVGAYEANPRPAPTPNLDALAARGAMFRSAYAEPLCSPGRAALLTGRRPVRNGIGTIVKGNRDGLSDREVLIPEALDPSWTSTAIGKWHLSPPEPAELDAPNRQGFDHFDGVWANPENAVTRPPDDRPRGHDHWEHVVDGEVSWSDEYLTTNQVDAAIASMRSMPEPWFAYVAPSLAHEPNHVPPDDLWAEADPSDEPGVGDAMIEALDHELGRLFAAVPPDTTVIVTSDNGTPGEFVRPPDDPEQAKSTVYAGGVRVPLLVVGPHVVPGPRTQLAHVTDVFATVLDFAGIDAADLGWPIDGTSLVPVLVDPDAEGGRQCAVAELFFRGDTDRRATAVIDEGLHYVRPRRGRDSLYRRDRETGDLREELLSGFEPLGHQVRTNYERLREVARFVPPSRPP